MRKELRHHLSYLEGASSRSKGDRQDRARSEAWRRKRNRTQRAGFADTSARWCWPKCRSWHPQPQADGALIGVAPMPDDSGSRHAADNAGDGSRCATSSTCVRWSRAPQPVLKQFYSGSSRAQAQEAGAGGGDAQAHRDPQRHVKTNSLWRPPYPTQASIIVRFHNPHYPTHPYPHPPPHLTPTGRVRAGLLSREITGEVISRSASAPQNLGSKGCPQHFATYHWCRGYPCPGKRETHGGFHYRSSSDLENNR